MGDKQLYKRFWLWFEKSSNRIWNFEQDQAAIFGDLKDQLKKIHPSLTFEIGPIEDLRRDFVISADGKRDAFSQVQGLYECAPQNRQWKFIAFRPRREAPKSMNYNEVKLNPSDLFFQLNPADDLIEIIVYLKSRESVNNINVKGAIFLLVDWALGEYDVETKVGPIEFLPYLGRGRQVNSIPYALLTTEFDKMWSRLHN